MPDRPRESEERMSTDSVVPRGPFEVQIGEALPDGSPRTVEIVNGRGEWVGSVPIRPHVKDPVALGHLYAASPDLYAALKGMVEWFACERGTAPVIAAQKALAKADGRPE